MKKNIKRKDLLLEICFLLVISMVYVDFASCEDQQPFCISDPFGPSECQNISSRTNGNIFKISWDEPTNSGESQILRYWVFLSIDGVQEWNSYDLNTRNMSKIFVPGKNYEISYNVIAENSNGNGTYSYNKTHTFYLEGYQGPNFLELGKPGAPGVCKTSARVSRSSTGYTIKIKWSAPEDKGDSEITGYYLYFSYPGEDKSIRGEEGTWSKVTLDTVGFSFGSPYEGVHYINAIAVNSHGLGSIGEDVAVQVGGSSSGSFDLGALSLSDPQIISGLSAFAIVGISVFMQKKKSSK